jgi:hypothetical protein
MEHKCSFLKINASEPHCKNKPTKNSDYCALHNYVMKNRKVRIPCLGCGKGTVAKYHMCMSCGANKIRLRHRYLDIDQLYKLECYRLRQIKI